MNAPTFRYEVTVVYSKPLDLYRHHYIAETPEKAEAMARAEASFKKHGGKITSTINTDVVASHVTPSTPDGI